jgi:CubicO group peptidase (beta-lactamase class C family)
MGYQWWYWPSQEIYSAHGHYEQAVYVSPEHDLVVVFNGNVPDGEFYPADSLIRDYIIPAIEGESTLPPGFVLILSGFAVIAVTIVIAALIIRKRNSRI